MSSYGPPGGQPQDPWPGRQDPYGEPADPWGGQEQRGGQDAWGSPSPWGGQPASGEPGAPTSPDYGGYQDHGGQVPFAGDGYGYGAYAQPADQPQSGAPAPVWGQPTPPPKRSSGLIIGIIVLVLLLVGGAGAAYYFVGRGGTDPATQPTSGPSPNGSPSGQPKGSASPGASANSTDVRFIAKGQCLVNDGTNKQPKMRIADCGKGAYEVVARFDRTVDWKTRCANVVGYTDFYFFDSELAHLDFVLCLKRL